MTMLEWERIKLLLKNASNEEYAKFVKTKKASYALLLSIQYQQYDIAKKLIEMGASTTESDEHGMTALHHTAKNNSIQIISLLAKRGTHEFLSIENANEETPLELAAKCGYWNAVETMLTMKYDHTEKTALTLGNVLRIAIREENYPAVQSLLKKGVSCQVSGNDLNERIKDWLQRLQERINKSTWKVQSLFCMWSTGKPYHVKKILKEIEKVDTTSPEIVLGRIMDILNKITPSSRRHHKTHDFYNQTFSEIKMMLSANNRPKLTPH